MHGCGGTESPKTRHPKLSSYLSQVGSFHCGCDSNGVAPGFPEVSLKRFRRPAPPAFDDGWVAVGRPEGRGATEPQAVCADASRVASERGCCLHDWRLNLMAAQRLAVGPPEQGVVSFGLPPLRCARLQVLQRFNDAENSGRSEVILYAAFVKLVRLAPSNGEHHRVGQRERADWGSLETWRLASPRVSSYRTLCISVCAAMCEKCV